MEYRDTQGSMEIPEAGWCLMQFLGNREEMTHGHPWSTSQLQVSEESLCCTSAIAHISAHAFPRWHPGSGSTVSAPGPPADGSVTGRRPGKTASAAPELNNWVQSQNIL